MLSKLLGWLDKRIIRFLTKNEKVIPMRWKKMIAFFYGDARIRKQYLEALHVQMGEGTYANFGLLTDATEDAPVIIGNNVSIAPNVTLITTSEPNNGIRIKEIAEVRERLTKSKAIVIEDDVWIGAGVTILPGVKVGACSVIGAGAVVVNDIDPYSIYVGIPAKKLRDLEPDKQKAN